MFDNMETMIDWSRAQFALTAMYHWLFVPLTLGLAVIMGIMETRYVVSGLEFWKRAARFWMKLFGINFAIGVATGLTLEFQFGTNWSNYSWFVGDIFGAPLAIEGIVAFFMEATFVAVMFFGWDKVGKKFHLASTWLTGAGATLSAWWILVANSWMQHPVGMAFNPETVRNEMVDFAAVAFSPVAVMKFLHTVLSSWIVGAVFVIGVSAWFLLKRRDKDLTSSNAGGAEAMPEQVRHYSRLAPDFALESMKTAAWIGLAASLLTLYTGDQSAYQVARFQPMKLAAMEALYDGGTKQPLTVVGDVKIPAMLSFLATRDFDGYVPGVNDILNGGYATDDGTVALSAAEKMAKGKTAVAALSEFRKARNDGDKGRMDAARRTLEENMPYFGYGYVQSPEYLVPHVGLSFWMFRVMVGLGMYFIAFFALILFLSWKGKLGGQDWLHRIAVASIPFAFVAGQAGWIVAETGRQPWAIQDLLPVNAAVSAVSAGTVQTTFFIFLFIFTVLFAAEISIMVKAIRKGPETE